MALQNACSEKRQWHRSWICSYGPSTTKPTLSILFTNTFIFTSHAITPDAASRSRAKHTKTMIFRISRFWSVQKTLLSGATRTVPNGPVFERRSLRSVLQKVLYSLPATPLPGIPSQHRTDPREPDNVSSVKPIRDDLRECFRR